MEDSLRFPVRFDDEAFAEELAHASAAGRRVGRDERRRFERKGISVDRLLACAEEGRDGTRLGGLVKTYVPAPAGDWGMVFRAGRDERGALLLLSRRSTALRQAGWGAFKGGWVSKRRSAP